MCYKIIFKTLPERLKSVIPKLISPEQAGFLFGRFTFDNILAAQEVAHSIETEHHLPPRMIVKVDIEKVFDTVEWNSIFATLQKMRFLAIWISWIESCLSLASSFFLINGQPSP